MWHWNYHLLIKNCCTASSFLETFAPPAPKEKNILFMKPNEKHLFTYCNMLLTYRIVGMFFLHRVVLFSFAFFVENFAFCSTTMTTPGDRRRVWLMPFRSSCIPDEPRKGKCNTYIRIHIFAGSRGWFCRGGWMLVGTEVWILFVSYFLSLNKLQSDGMRRMTYGSSHLFANYDCE